MSFFATITFRRIRLRNLRCQTLAAFLWLIVSGGGSAAGLRNSTDSDTPTLATEISSTMVQVAEPITLELTVTASLGSKVEFPVVGQSLGQFEVTDQIELSDVPATGNDRQRTWSCRLTLESIAAGNVEIPSLEIRVHSDGKSEVLKSDAISIQVASVLDDSDDPSKFRDIQSVVDVEVPRSGSYTWMWWTSGIAGILVAAVAFLVTRSRRGHWIAPDVWAMRELVQLRTSEAMQSLSSDVVTANLSMILRDYLKMQFEIAAPVQTTAELLVQMESRELISRDLLKEYANVFENTDRARFSGLHLSREELHAAISDAQRLVDLTASSPDPGQRPTKRTEVR